MAAREYAARTTTSGQAVAASAQAFATPARLAGPDPDGVEVSGVTLDSRGVRPGDLYAALPGARVHGAKFAAAAVAAGAVAILTDATGLELIGSPPVPVVLTADPRAVLGYVAAAVYGRPAEALRLVGITGTNGKTTTAYLLDSALRATGRRTGLIGTVGIRIGDQQVPSERTTPESPDLHALFAMMAEQGVEVVTMEVSSHALALHRVDGAAYEVAAFTNLSQDHLDFHQTMEDYFAAKASLFTPARCGRAVVVTEDDWGLRLAGQALAAGLPVVTLAGAEHSAARGRDAPDWVFAPDDNDPMAFALTRRDRPQERWKLRSGLPGRYNLLNTAVAALIMLALGYDAAQVSEAVGGDPGVPGRLERVDLGSGAPGAVVDFAHTPDAITATLAALRGTMSPAGLLVAVLGAGGGRDPSKRPLMGAAAARLADVVIVTDDNPREEDPAAIRASVLAGAREAGEPSVRPVIVEEVADRTQALARALRLAGREGLVAALGKGHEVGQEIAGTIHPYEDRAAFRTAYRLVTGASTQASEPAGGAP